MTDSEFMVTYKDRWNEVGERIVAKDKAEALKLFKEHHGYGLMRYVVNHNARSRSFTVRKLRARKKA